VTFTRRWFLLFILGGVPLLFTGQAMGFLTLTLLWEGTLLIATVADYLLLPAPSQIEIERDYEPQMSLGTENPVRIHLRNNSPMDWHLLLLDEPPERFPHDYSPMKLTLLSQVRQTVAYHVSPRVRGDYSFGDIWIKITGRLGLVHAIRRYPRSSPVKVYPNILEMAKFTLMARRGRLQQVGIRAARLAGAGREFESLREYQPDDEYRRIDWKATARRGKLISRQYEVERSQNVILILDVGRTMLAEIDGIAKMDYAINAALLLAYVASMTDDRIGLLVFADTVQTWLPPAKGRSQVYRILESLYNAKARRAEADYRGAMAYLSMRWRRRSLMVCFTDLWDPESARQTITELAALQPRHLVACATLMDTKVMRCAEKTVQTASDAYEQAVALQMLEERSRAVYELNRRGVLVVDTPAEKLTAALVNRYLEVKEKMLL
jgi:uncharacterized protein (DUF58 family)